MAPMCVDDRLRGAMQISRARVIAEARPEMQDLVDGGGRERGDVGEALHEHVVVRDDRAYLCLLQHDLRDPYAIGRGVALPRQMLAAVLVEPPEERFGERALAHGDATVLLRSFASFSTLVNSCSVPARSVLIIRRRPNSGGIQNLGMISSRYVTSVPLSLACHCERVTPHRTSLSSRIAVASSSSGISCTSSTRCSVRHINVPRHPRMRV